MRLNVLVEGADGPRPPVLLLHGLTATHRYVVMGSRRLARDGHPVIAYDARGHGASEPAEEPDAYGYDDLAADARRVLDEQGIDRAVLVGASMGAHTALRVALDTPERVAGLVLVTPAFLPGRERDEHGLERWDRLAAGLRAGGVEGFLDAYRFEDVPEEWRATVRTVTRQRLSQHEHPAAVADALRVVPRSAVLSSLDELGAIDVPTTVVGSRDEADPTHPLGTARRYAAGIPGATLVVEEPGESPVAWRGARLSAIVGELAARTTT